MQRALLLCLLPASLMIFAPVACGGDDTADDAGTVQCPDYGNVSGADVSFRSQVLPIMQRSCGISTSCHGSMNPPTETNQHRAYLGPPTADGPATEEQIAEIRAQNVNKDAVKAPGMKVIEPGNAGASFLMRKMDGLCGDGLTCSGDACGHTMPDLSSTLPEAERVLFRLWIQQGAQDN